MLLCLLLVAFHLAQPSAGSPFFNITDPVLTANSFRYGPPMDQFPWPQESEDAAGNANHGSDYSSYPGEIQSEEPVSDPLKVLRPIKEIKNVASTNVTLVKVCRYPGKCRSKSSLPLNPSIPVVRPEQIESLHSATGYADHYEDYETAGSSQNVVTHPFKFGARLKPASKEHETHEGTPVPFLNQVKSTTTTTTMPPTTTTAVPEPTAETTTAFRPTKKQRSRTRPTTATTKEPVTEAATTTTTTSTESTPTEEGKPGEGRAAVETTFTDPIKTRFAELLKTRPIFRTTTETQPQTTRRPLIRRPTAPRPTTVKPEPTTSSNIHRPATMSTVLQAEETNEHHVVVSPNTPLKRLFPLRGTQKIIEEQAAPSINNLKDRHRFSLTTAPAVTTTAPATTFRRFNANRGATTTTETPQSVVIVPNMNPRLRGKLQEPAQSSTENSALTKIQQMMQRNSAKKERLPKENVPVQPAEKVTDSSLKQLPGRNKPMRKFPALTVTTTTTATPLTEPTTTKAEGQTAKRPAKNNARGMWRPKATTASEATTPAITEHFEETNAKPDGQKNEDDTTGTSGKKLWSSRDKTAKAELGSLEHLQKFIIGATTTTTRKPWRPKHRKTTETTTVESIQKSTEPETTTEPMTTEATTSTTTETTTSVMTTMAIVLREEPDELSHTTTTTTETTVLPTKEEQTPQAPVDVTTTTTESAETTDANPAVTESVTTETTALPEVTTEEAGPPTTPANIDGDEVADVVFSVSEQFNSKEENEASESLKAEDHFESYAAIVNLENPDVSHVPFEEPSSPLVHSLEQIQNPQEVTSSGLRTPKQHVHRVKDSSQVRISKSYSESHVQSSQHVSGPLNFDLVGASSEVNQSVEYASDNEKVSQMLIVPRTESTTPATTTTTTTTTPYPGLPYLLQRASTVRHPKNLVFNAKYANVKLNA